MALGDASIRRAGPSDTHAIAAVIVQGWQAAYRGLVSDAFLDGLSVDGREVAWRNRFENDPDGLLAVWLAEVDGLAVGFIGSGPAHDPDLAPPSAEVYSLYLLPEAWRQGLGKRLLLTAVEHWQGRGVGTLVLWVMEGNSRARSFYEAQGWRLDGARQAFALGDANVPEVRYRRQIEP